MAQTGKDFGHYILAWSESCIVCQSTLEIQEIPGVTLHVHDTKQSKQLYCIQTEGPQLQEQPLTEFSSLHTSDNNTEQTIPCEVSTSPTGANGDFLSAWAAPAPLYPSCVRIHCHNKAHAAEHDQKENLLCFPEFLLVRGVWKLGPEARSPHGSRLASCFPILLHKLPCLCYFHKLANHVISPSLVSLKEEGCCFCFVLFSLL